MGEPLSKLQSNNQHWNEIQYEFEVEDDLGNLSYHKIRGIKSQYDTEEKSTDYQCTITCCNMY